MTSFTVPAVINGAYTVPDQTFDVVCPGTGEKVHQCALSDAATAVRAVEAAAEAFPAWSRSPLGDRRRIFLEAARLMGEEKEKFFEAMSQEISAPGPWAQFNVQTTVSIIEGVVGVLGCLAGEVTTLQDPGSSGMILYEPYGVALAIAPWNAPAILGARSFLFPIAAGNTVVFKGSELSPRVHFLLVDIMHRAGLPRGVLNFVVTTPQHAPAVTEALIAHPATRKVNFTGSTNVGRIISRLAGHHLKPVVMELGGKASAVVCEDADLDLAAAQCALGAFLFSGQICMSTERVLVHASVGEAFEEKFVAAVRAQEEQMGVYPVVINDASLEKNTALLEDAVSKGAVLLNGSVDGKVQQAAGPRRMLRAIVKDVTPEMKLYKTESFGPSVSLIRFSSEDEAISIANNTEYGLSSAVFTRDLATGLRLARSIEAGAVHINSMTVHDEPALPHGGFKASGWGRFNGVYGLREWVQTKSVTWKV
ncbi:hypothetical protein NLU13_7308 [Sarocladium strictum]|uniref:Aldehyde dehydrogenase domain-containing protein n=1 Tax=Sarocladium strictum TaxID=5046 RepID=A0AA39L5L5_SARSR|nr:hypothetical protein NLU13_7308 [Sarocladium strictum]